MEIFLNEYVHDRAHRAMTVNLSETGVYVNRVLTPMLRSSKVISLEIDVPELGERIWTRGEICHDTFDEYFHGQGIRFTGMAKMHSRLLRDYCVEKRQNHLHALLQRVRRSSYH